MAKTKICWNCNMEVEKTTKQCPSCSAILGNQNPKTGKANTPEEQKKDERNGCLMITGLCVLLCLGISTCGDRKKDATASQPIPLHQPVFQETSPLDDFKKTLEKVRSCGVESAEVSILNGKVKLDIGFNETTVVSGNNLILVTAGKIKRCFKEVKKQDRLKTLGFAVVTIKAPLSDKYGNETAQPILRYTFQGEDLDKINWDVIDQQSLLEFASPDWLHIEGAAAAKEYALQGNHSKMAPTFCRIAIYGK